MGLSRRHLLRLLAVASAGPLAGAAGTSCTAGQPPVRREITSAAAAHDVDLLAAAVATMRALPDSDPRSWTRQAQLHRDHGRHAGWLFLPWHRAYLHCFEQICRELTGDATFALPYWDWTAHPRIPPVFFDALCYGSRAVGPGATADPTFVGTDAVAALLDQPNFLLFGGAAASPADTYQYGAGYGLVEQGPHNYVHGFVGATMGTFLSPLDPIFWAHHSRLDQMWTQWNLDRAHADPDAPEWWETEFTEFCDGRGRPVTLSVAQTEAMPLASYRYDSAARPPAPPARASTTVQTLRAFPGTVSRASDAGAEVLFPGTENERLDAHLVFGFAGVASGAVRVYLGREYVGSVAFFAHEAHDAHEAHEGNTGPAPVPYRLPVGVVGGPDPLTATFVPVGGPDTAQVTAQLLSVRSTVDRGAQDAQKQQN